MAKNSTIEWTHHTFNPWWGCVKVSPACKNCYAETWSKRVGFSLWGSKSRRRFFSEKHWNEPLKWDKEARLEGVRRRVFCASMADVLEARAELNPWRARLWSLIELTPNLNWLILTKRPHKFGHYLPSPLPRNIWLGTTVENQHWAEVRLPHISSFDTHVRFLSCEPLLGSLDLTEWLKKSAIDWVIAGGESGPKARVTDPRWVQSLRDQCLKFGVAFHFKQWGHWAPHRPSSRKRVAPIVTDDGQIVLWRHSKKEAGRMLDGRTWDQVPMGSTA